MLKGYKFDCATPAPGVMIAIVAGALSAVLMLVLAPIAAVLIQPPMSRSREFAADANGAKVTGNPYGLARALEKLRVYSRLPAATAHLFIVQPLVPARTVHVILNSPAHPNARRAAHRADLRCL